MLLTGQIFEQIPQPLQFSLVRKLWSAIGMSSLNDRCDEEFESFLYRLENTGFIKINNNGARTSLRNTPRVSNLPFLCSATNSLIALSFFFWLMDIFCWFSTPSFLSVIFIVNPAASSPPRDSMVFSDSQLWFLACFHMCKRQKGTLNQCHQAYL